MEYAKMIYVSALSIFSITLTGILNYFGGWDSSLETLCVFMAIDYVTGIICALVWHKSKKTDSGTFESKASLKGLFRKGGILLVVLIATRLDILACCGDNVRTTVILFFIVNEGLSIIENLGIMGLPLPDVIKKSFNAIKAQEEDSPDK